MGCNHNTSNRYLAASIFTLSNEMTTCRLLWALENISTFRKASETGDAMFGTLDTWLLYKLTGGVTYVSEISNASGTGMFDPFTVTWGAFVFKGPFTYDDANFCHFLTPFRLVTTRSFFL